jgi:hypothetical protein
MKCEACHQEITPGDELFVNVGFIHASPCPELEDIRQKYLEAQAQNMYIVWRCANNDNPHTEWVAPEWKELHPDYRKVWYTVTAAALGMHKF